ncbi:hypothetical protein [Synechococcus sp. A15-127]|uniref:hypothetical protein n=1 Tax=Synechococcus sp. A15-127 TaxID=1050624 RepID=UPI001645A9A6|nr:hypothetical protein [Synechococcus sp. A15-127]
MRFLAAMAVMFVMGSHAAAHDGKATAQGVTEMFATGEAMRLVPKRATVTDTTCKSIDVAADTRYQCTVTYSD